MLRFTKKNLLRKLYTKDLYTLKNKRLILYLN